MNPVKVIQYVAIPLFIIGIILTFSLWNFWFLLVGFSASMTFIAVYIAFILVKFNDDVEDFYDKTIDDVEDLLRVIHKELKRNEYSEYDGTAANLYKYLSSYGNSLVQRVNDTTLRKFREQKELPDAKPTNQK